MNELLSIIRVDVRFSLLGDRRDYVGHLEIECLVAKEAYGLTVSALASKYPDLDTVVSLRVNGMPIRSVEADCFERFEIGELVLAANPVNNMIDPLPAYTTWELREISEIPFGGPPFLVGDDGEVTYYAMVPYGVRKVKFYIQEIG